MGASSFPGYTATLDLRSSRIRSGDNLQGVVVFRNTGKVAVRVDSVNPVEVVITLRGTRTAEGSRVPVTGHCSAPINPKRRSSWLERPAATADGAQRCRQVTTRLWAKSAAPA